MGHAIDTLAHFVAETPLAAIPEPVRRHARLTMLDTVGVILAGFARPELAALRTALAPSSAGPSTLFTSPPTRTDPRTAALLNGMAGRAVELCEGLRFASGQVALQVLPGLLATAEPRRSPGPDIEAAFILGYEAAARLCIALTPRPLAHQNGQASLIGAVAATARLQGMDGPAIARAMQVAATLLLTPSYTGAVAGATALNVAGGMSAFAAALVPELARAGYTAEPDAVELALGQLVGNGFDAASIPAGFAEEWSITRNYFRLHACCNPIHPALDCIIDALATRPGTTADEVAAIHVDTFRFASVMASPHPPNWFASKYSLPHAAAALLVRGGTSHAHLDDSALEDPRIAALRPLIHLREDPALTALVPRQKPARATITLHDGTTLAATRQSHRGDPAEPYPEAAIRAKFLALATTTLSLAAATRLESAIDRCEELPSIDPLLDPLQAPDPP